MKCETCVHWKYTAKCDESEDPKYKVCAYFTEIRHSGPRVLDTYCNHCGRGIREEHEDFDLNEHMSDKGLGEAFEGWGKTRSVGITNFCIITAKDQSCSVYREKQ